MTSIVKNIRLHSVASLTARFASLMLMLLLLWWRKELFLDCITSAQGVTSHQAVLTKTLVQNWIAAVLFIFVTVVGLLRIFAIRKHGPFQTLLNNQRAVPIMLSVLVMGCAPLLTRLDPEMQGDLRTTRLLPPCAAGIVWSTRPINNWEIPVAMSLNWANDRLVHENEQFSAFDPAVPHEFSEKIVFLLGTDALGRDIFSRLVYGIRISILVGLIGGLCSVVLGTFIGILAGMAGGWVESMLMRLTDFFLALPALILIIALVAFWGNSAGLLIGILAGTGWMSTARLVRGEILFLREREFILSAKLFGRSSWQIAFDHMIPNLTPMIITASLLQFANILLAEAALGFLGLGLQPPAPSLGNMMGDGLPYLGTAWWCALAPAAALAIVVVAANMIAGKRDERRSELGVTAVTTA